MLTINEINTETIRKDLYTDESECVFGVEFDVVVSEVLFYIRYPDGYGVFFDGNKIAEGLDIFDDTLTPEDVEKYPYVIWYNK